MVPPWQCTAIVVAWCLISFGTASLFAVAPVILTQVVAAGRTSEATGMLVVLRGLAQGVGTMIVTTLLASEVVRDPAGKASYPTETALQITQ